MQYINKKGESFTFLSRGEQTILLLLCKFTFLRKMSSLGSPKTSSRRMGFLARN